MDNTDSVAERLQIHKQPKDDSSDDDEVTIHLIFDD